MKTRALILLILTSLLLNGCDFGRGAEKYSSTWDYTFHGKGQREPRPPKPIEPQQPAVVRQVQPAPQVQRAPQVQPTPQVLPTPQVRMERRADHNVVSQTYPCGSCGVIRLDRWMPTQVLRGVPFMYTIKVTNLTQSIVQDIVVREDLADNFQVVGSDPQAQMQGRTLIWALGAMQPNTSREITVKGIAASESSVLHCATLTYVVPACAGASVVHAELLVAKVIAEEALLCDVIPMRVGVKNTGSAVAHNVIIHDPLPSGLTTVAGETDLKFNVGTLQPGQAREYPVDLKALHTGVYENVAAATSDSGVWTKSAPATVTVRQPALTITKSGPAERYAGRPVNYQITVVNKGNALAENLIVVDAIPAGFAFVSADNRGTVRDNRVVWNLPALAPNQSQTVNVAYKANRQGVFESQAVAQALCVDPVSTSVQTSVRGIAAVLLEVIDLNDPVEVGSNETYLVTATNQGSSESTNVRIVCILEENVEYASSDGPTQATVQGPKISFAPLPRLAPGAKATWKVVVTALEPGDVRFSVIMNTDQLGRPVEETESTIFYQ